MASPWKHTKGLIKLRLDFTSLRTSLSRRTNFFSLQTSLRGCCDHSLQSSASPAWIFRAARKFLKMLTMTVSQHCVMGRFAQVQDFGARLERLAKSRSDWN